MQLCPSEQRRPMMSDHTWEPWNFRDPEAAMLEGQDLTGFEGHATDGHIGKVDEASAEVGASQIVVDTGPWFFGRQVLLPAACIERIEWDEEKVYVDRTKDQIEGSPELEEGPRYEGIVREWTVGGGEGLRRGTLTMHARPRVQEVCRDDAGGTQRGVRRSTGRGGSRARAS